MFRTASDLKLPDMTNCQLNYKTYKRETVLLINYITNA